MDEEIKTAAEEVESTPMPETPATPEAPAEEAPKKDLGDKLEEARDKAAEKLEEAKEKVNESAPDTTGDYTPEDINGHKLLSICSYLGILILLPLFLAKDSKFTRFHVNQGLILIIAELIVWAISKIPGTLMSVIAWVLNVILLVYAIIGIVNVVNGKAKELPFIGKYRLIK